MGPPQPHAGAFRSRRRSIFVASALVASPSLPDGTVPANVPFGIADASLSGTVYTPQSAKPVTIHLPSGDQESGFLNRTGER